MSFEKKILAVINLVKSKSVNGVSEINYTGNKKLSCNTFLFAKNNDGSYTLYNGCELIVGDVSLNYCALCMFDECGEGRLSFLNK